ncbi:MAG: LuxR C-terminal-related transcriptional regulator [Saprospiraceae bacterium]
MNRTVILYGLALALLTAMLKSIEYRYMLRDFSTEFYVGMVALLFTGLGLWVGLKWKQSREKTPLYPKTSTDLPKVNIHAEQLAQIGLSQREFEVLQLMATGCSNQEIADRLFISLNTVKTHSSNLFAKLGVKRRTQAVQKAKELQLLS